MSHPDRMTLDRAFRILSNELEGYATITRTRRTVKATAIEARDRGYVERQADYWLGSYKRIGEIRIACHEEYVQITETR